MYASTIPAGCDRRVHARLATMETLSRAGFARDSMVAAVTAGDLTLLEPDNDITRALINALGDVIQRRFDPAELRDPHGKWTRSIGGRIQKALDDWAKGDRTGDPFTLPADEKAVREVEVENKIRAAYRDAAGNKGGFVNIADVRTRLGTDVPRAEVDAALQRMERTRAASLAPQDYPSKRTPAVAAAAVKFGGRDNHLVQIADPSSRPLPAGKPIEREPLRQAALAHGITLKRGASRDEIAAALKDHYVSGRPNAPKAPPGKPTGEPPTRHISEMSESEILNYVNSGHVSRRDAVAELRKRADGYARSADGLRMGDASGNVSPAFAARAREQDARAAQLRKLADDIEKGAPKAPAKRAPAAGKPALSDTSIAQAYERLSGGKAHEWVRVADLRKELGGTRAEQDAALLRLGRGPNASLIPNEDRKSLTPEDIEQAVQLHGGRGKPGGSELHLFRIEPGAKIAPAKATSGDATLKATAVNPTGDQLAAVTRMGGDGAYVVNNDLRANGGNPDALTPKNRATVEHLDALMANSPLSQGIVVHRKLSMASNPFSTSTGPEIDPLKRDLTGFSWTELGYSSTDVAGENLAHREISLRITVPAGTPAISHKELDSGEVLLPRGSTFKVAADHGGFPRQLDVTVVPAVTDAHVDASLAKAYESLARHPNDLVRISDLRKQMGGTREQQDAALLRLGRMRDGSVMPNENQKSLTPEEHAAATVIAGREHHLVKIEQSTLDKLKSGRGAATPAAPKALTGHDALEAAPYRLYGGGSAQNDPRIDAALRQYSGFRFGQINGDLRKEGPLAPRSRPTVRLIDQAMASSKLTHDVEAVRVVQAAPASFGGHWSKDMVGVEFDNPQYLSTSTNPNLIEGFGYKDRAGVAVMHLNVPAGTAAVSLSTRRGNANEMEHELLLDRGLTYRVTGQRVDEKGVRHFDVEVVPKAATPAPAKAAKAAAGSASNFPPLPRSGRISDSQRRQLVAGLDRMLAESPPEFRQTFGGRGSGYDNVLNLRNRIAAGEENWEGVGVVWSSLQHRYGVGTSTSTMFGGFDKPEARFLQKWPSGRLLATSASMKAPATKAAPKSAAEHLASLPAGLTPGQKRARLRGRGVAKADIEALVPLKAATKAAPAVKGGPRPSGLPHDRAPVAADFTALSERIAGKPEAQILQALQDLNASELVKLANKFPGVAVIVPSGGKTSERRQGLKIPDGLTLEQKRQWLAKQLGTTRFHWRSRALEIIGITSDRANT